MTDLRSGASRTGTGGGNGAGTGRQRTFRLWPPELYWTPAPDGGWIRKAAAEVTPASLWRYHRLFTVVVLLSLIPRILAALGFAPALFIQDSFSYMGQGVHLAPSPTRPVGYSALLWVMRPLHSLLAVTTVQHLMGIAMAIIIYALLRSRGLPGWGATLATLPTLFDSRQIWSESSILPDTLFAFVALVVVALLLAKRTPKLWQTALAGLLVSWASVIRGNGVFIFVPVIIYLLVRRVGWRAVTACVVAFAVPLLGYMGWFYRDFGSFDLTNSTGIFLWARTTSFANCAVIKPPPDLAPLCPDRQPGHPTGPAPAWSVTALLHERTPPEYLWNPGAWWQHGPHPGINGYNNKRAEQFSIKAVEAQPLSYLATVGKDVALAFLTTDRSTNFLSMHFTVKPHVASTKGYMARNERAYAHTTSNTHPVKPWSYFMFLYQDPVFFPGIALFAVMLVGLVRLIRRWRTTWSSAALPWALSLVNLVMPIAITDIDYRYIITAVPFACLAAGMAFAPSAGRGLRTAVAGAPASDAASALPWTGAQAPGGETLPPAGSGAAERTDVPAGPDGKSADADGGPRGAQARAAEPPAGGDPARVTPDSGSDGAGPVTRPPGAGGDATPPDAPGER